MAVATYCYYEKLHRTMRNAIVSYLLKPFISRCSKAVSNIDTRIRHKGSDTCIKMASPKIDFYFELFKQLKNHVLSYLTGATEHKDT